MVGIIFILVRVHAKTDADGKKIFSNFKSVRTREMIEEERTRIHDEEFEDWIREQSMFIQRKNIT